MNAHEVRLLKEYMADLVEQARQEAMTNRSVGISETPYGADEALLDLLAILDDRLESEGVQVGLSEAFRHEMWGVCQRARQQVTDSAWIQSNLSAGGDSKARTREVAYLALLTFIREETEG